MSAREGKAGWRLAFNKGRAHTIEERRLQSDGLLR
jgi:hypothetical protein